MKTQNVFAAIPLRHCVECETLYTRSGMNFHEPPAQWDGVLEGVGTCHKCQRAHTLSEIAYRSKQVSRIAIVFAVVAALHLGLLVLLNWF